MDPPNVEGSLQTRSRPKMLAETIAQLTDDQEKVVIEMGFKNLLKLTLKEIPGNFALHVVSSLRCLDTKDVVMETPNGNILVDSMAVHEVLGLPLGHKKIIRKRKSNYANPLFLKWKTHSHNSLKLKDVADRIKETTSCNRMFQMDFMVLMVTTMISAMPSNTINRTFLTSFSENFVSKECKEFDWCEYVVSSVKKSMKDWDPSGSNNYFTGPLTFLMLLYCDRVSVMLDRPVERKRPVIAEWKHKDLRRRMVAELDNGGYGSGELLVEWKKTQEGRQYRMTVLASHGKDVHFVDCGCAPSVLEDEEEPGRNLMDSPVSSFLVDILCSMKQLDDQGGNEEGTSSQREGNVDRRRRRRSVRERRPVENADRRSVRERRCVHRYSP